MLLAGGVGVVVLLGSLHSLRTRTRSLAGRQRKRCDVLPLNCCKILQTAIMPYNFRLSLRREWFGRVADTWCSIRIPGLFFTYFTVVKGAFSVFDCTSNRDGIFVLDADPSILCDQVSPGHYCCTRSSITRSNHLFRGLLLRSLAVSNSP